MEERKGECCCNCWPKFRVTDTGSFQTDPETSPWPTRTAPSTVEHAIFMSLFCLFGIIAFGLVFYFCAHWRFLSAPYIASQLHSFSLSLSNSSTLNCDVVLSLKNGNNNSDNALYVDMARASVFYEEQRLFDKLIDRFYVEDEPILLKLNFKAVAAEVAGDVASAREENQRLRFDFKVDGVGRLIWGEDDKDKRTKGVIEINCVSLKLGFSSHSTAMELITAPLQCRSSFH